MAKKSNYSKQLVNPQWQRKRLELMNLRGFKCEICGNEEQELHVHHRFYIKGRQAWEYDNDVFQVLCSTCHEKEHSKEVKITEKIVEVIPLRYERLISLFEEAIKRFPPNEWAIPNILHENLQFSKYTEYFSDIATINTSEKRILFESIIYDFSQSVQDSNDLNERIGKLEDIIEKIKPQN